MINVNQSKKDCGKWFLPFPCALTLTVLKFLCATYITTSMLIRNIHDFRASKMARNFFWTIFKYSIKYKNKGFFFFFFQSHKKNDFFHKKTSLHILSPNHSGLSYPATLQLNWEESPKKIGFSRLLSSPTGHNCLIYNFSLL